MSDTSMTKISDSEFSLDGDDQDNSVTLVANARQSLNLPVATTNKDKSSGGNHKKKSKDNNPTMRSKSNTKKVSGNRAVSSVNFLNSDKWPKETRPPHLEDDEVFNTLSVEAAANHIMQWMTNDK